MGRDGQEEELAAILRVELKVMFAVVGPWWRRCQVTGVDG